MKPYLILALLAISTAYALTPVFVGTAATINFTVACSENPSTLGGLTSGINIGHGLNPFRGESIGTTLDLTNPANTPIIALNYGNPSLQVNEFCDPVTQELVETACALNYIGNPGILGNEVGAYRLSQSDLTLFGANPADNWACVDRRSFVYPTNTLSISNPAFYAPAAPTPYAYQTPGVPGPMITSSSVAGGTGVPSLQFTADAVPGTTIDGIYLVGPAPTQAIAGGPVPCGGTQCTLPPTIITCPGIYWEIALQSDNVASAVWIEC